MRYKHDKQNKCLYNIPFLILNYIDIFLFTLTIIIISLLRACLHDNKYLSLPEVLLYESDMY